MRGRIHILFVIGLVAAITGCTTGSYTAPNTTEVKPFETVVNASYDTVWTALIDHASQNFFAIDNFEKDSGLLTLSFGSSTPSRFVDCGHWVVSGMKTYNGLYVDYLNQYGAVLSGKMNVTVRKLSEAKISVRTNARYILTRSGVSMPNTIYATPFNDTWTFDSGSSATIQVSNAAAGTAPYRTCKPTYVAEQSVINAVAALSN